MKTSSYTLKNNDLILDGRGKRYELKIHDLPAEEKPREKMIQYGPSVLSVKELLAVVLNTGTKKEDVLKMASRLSTEYGEKALANHKSVKKLSEELGIPSGKAAQIVACFELGRRFYERRGTVSVIRSPKDVYEYLGEMRDLSKEHLHGIYIDAHHRVLHDEVISIGTVNSNLIHPREVFRPAIEYGAVAVILVHNHPSGIVNPSDADIEVTKQIVATGKVLGINLIDHVIIAKEKFASIEVDYEQ